MSAPLYLIAILRAKAGAEAELGRRLGELIAPTRKEAGNLRYELHQSNDNAGTWILYETWRSRADLDLHFKEPLIAAMLKDFPKLLRQDMELHFMTRTDAIERAA